MGENERRKEDSKGADRERRGKKIGREEHMSIRLHLLRGREISCHARARDFEIGLPERELRGVQMRKRKREDTQTSRQKGERKEERNRGRRHEETPILITFASADHDFLLSLFE